MKIKSLIFLAFLLFTTNCKTKHFEKLGLVKPQKGISYLPADFAKFDIFSYILFELNEPKLFGLKNGNIEIYRLTSIISFGGDNSVITIIKNRQDNSIHKFSDVDSFKKSRIINKKIKISDINFKKFSEELKSFDYQNMQKFTDSNVDDGIQYALEFYEGGKYSVITRNNPQTGKNPDKKFLEITKLFHDLK